MKFPKNLYQGYQLLKTCSLVQKRDYSAAALQEFVDILNSCQPNPEDMDRFSTVKDFYNASKHEYLKYIRNSHLECTVPWTESKTIVNWFRLNGVVYLSYDYISNKYNIQAHRALGVSDVNNAVSNSETVPQKKYRELQNIIDLRLSEFPTLPV